MPAPQISLTLACYNEGKFIFKSVKEISKVMDKTGLSYEIILFNDCSSDNTLANLKKIAFENPKVRVFSHAKNVGRGGTVRDAIFKSNAPIVGFLDVDLEGPAYFIPEFIKAIREGNDVAIAVRNSEMGIMHFHRVVFGLGYRFLEKLLLGIKVKDSQAGYKFFNMEKILPILKETRNEHWFWDTEVMLISEIRGLKIKEIEISFKKNPQSRTTAKFASDIWKYVKELFALRKRLKQLR